MPVPNLTVGDVVETRVVCTALNQVAINIGHYTVGPVVGQIPYDYAANEISGVWGNLYVACMPASATYIGVGLRRISPSPLTIEYVYNGSQTPGTASGDLLPAQISGLIKYRTGLAGRRNRGRNYIPFPADSFVTADGTPSGAYNLALTALADAIQTLVLVDGANSATMYRCVYPGAGPVANIVELCEGVDKWATQRRRGNYGQPNVNPW